MSFTKQRQRLAVALDLARQNIPVFPYALVGNDKVPIIEGWNSGAASTDPGMLEAWFSNGSDWRVGVPTGACSGIDAIDTDPRNNGHVWYAAHPELSGTRTHATMRGGKHSLLRHHEGIRTSHDKLGRGVDVLGDGGFLAWWPAEGLGVTNADTILDWPPELLKLALGSRARANGEEVPLDRRLPPSAQAVVDLLNRLPNPLSVSRDVYLAVMTGARGCIVALSEAGRLDDTGADAIRDAAVAWARRWEGYKGTDELQKWEDDFGRCDGKLAGWRTIQQHAKALIPEYADGLVADEFRALGSGSGGNAPPQKPKRPYTLEELRVTDISPIMWVIPGYLPEGLTVLAGRPKIGKSWLVLQIALTVATGGTMFDVTVEQGDVFYGAFEDSPRRLHDRVIKTLSEFGTWPATCEVWHQLAALDEGGLDGIQAWCKSHPKRRLIILDVLAKVRGRKRRDEEQYQYDYRMISGLQELSLRYKVAIIVVHHVRKTTAEDVLDTVSGTTGIAGSADSVMVLGRAERAVRLYLRGRDIEETDKVVTFDKATGTWSIEGDFDEVGGSLKGLRRQIYDHLVRAGQSMMPKEVAETLGKSQSLVRKTMQRMVDKGELEQETWGAYQPSSKAGT
jgi:AAA domain/Bifunctional DNA primase/polymerase, N-terminal